MNRNRYRLVFNRLRGQIMAVAETAASHSTAPGQAGHQAENAASALSGLLVRGRNGLPHLLVSGAVFMAVSLAALPGHAQIVADRSAPATQQATILNTASGIPQINIQTPSAAGVSRNTYTQFDVQRQGAVLNNSRQDTQTQLAGWVQANPWLAAGTARVILNEVNSSNPSLLKGYIEVAGDRAQVVIANPAGISCDGCGFVNASRATLTTGTPILSGGSLESYRVQGGVISINGAGMDASRADYTDLISRAVKVNAGIWASELKVTTGLNVVNADHTQTSRLPSASASGPAPSYAIDVAQLGGMYAGKIVLVGTEAGLGVRNAGQIGASVGEVTVTIDGRLENSNQITSNGNIRINTGSDISNTGSIYAQNDLSLTTGVLENTAGFIGALGNVAINGTAVTNTGHLGSGKDIALSVTGLVNAGGQIMADGGITISAGIGTINNIGGLLRAGEDISVTAGEFINRDTGGTDQGVDGASVTANAALVDNSRGAIYAVQSLKINSGNSILNSDGLLSAGQSLSLLDPNASTGRNAAEKTLSITNLNGTLMAGLSLQVDSASFGGDGKLLSLGDLSVKVLGDYLHTGQMQSDGSLTIETAGVLTNRSSIQGGTTLSITAATLDNQASGQLSASQINLKATDTHTFTNRGVINGQDTFIDAITLNNLGTGRIYGDHVSLGATVLNNLAENGVAPVIAARSRLDIGATTINNSDNALIYSAGDIVIGGSLDSNHQAIGQSSLLTNSSATIQAENNLFVNADQVINKRTAFSVQQTTSSGSVEYALLGWSTPGPWGMLLGAWVTQTDTVVLADSGAGQLLAGGSMTFNGAITNDRSNILAGGNITLDQARYVGIGQQGLSLKTAIGASYYCTGCAVGDEMSYVGYYVLGDPSGLTGSGRIRENILAALADMKIALTPQILQTWSVSGVQIQYQKLIGYNAGYGGDDNIIISPINTGGLQPIYVFTNLQDLVNGYLSPYYSSNIATATYDLAPAKLTANRSITGTATQIDNLNLIGVGQTAGNPTTAPGSSGSGNSQVGSIPTQIPTNALYSLDAAPGSHYLVETDPAFANYKSWLSSDYMLQTLSLDPALTQKRLGDGYYEQQLVREQVAQLTGRRFLNGYTSDEAEYQSLMNAGVTYAQAHQLVPGIALSAEQVAQLTSDIVWLVDKEVTLPDGSTTHALVPQVYVKLQAGDLNSNGSLIGGDAVNLQVSGNITNNGTIAGRNVLSLTAENINNEGGTISGAVASLAARADINNIGGQISGTDSLTVSAGHNLNVSSTTVDYQAGSANYRNATTTVARTAGLYVTGASGTLLASAGNDINLVAAAIDSKGTAQIQAGNNLNIGTVATRSTLNTDRDADNYEHRTSTSEAGSTITSQRNLSLIAGTDLTVRAATISSTNGGIGFTAGQDINLLAGQATQTMDAANKDVSGGFFSSKTTIDRTSTYDTYALGSTASGNTVTAVAGRDLTVKGSNVVGGQGVTLAAGNQLTVSAAEEQHFSSHFHSEKESGLFSSGGLSVTLGTRSEKLTEDSQSTTLASSSVGSVAGIVTLLAGTNYQQVASNVMAPQGDVSITAPKVDILAGTETSQFKQTFEAKQSGLTLSITNPIVSAVQTVQQVSQAANKTSDPRMQALAAASVALAANHAYEAVKAGQVLDNANLADQAGGINLSVSLGSSKSQSTSTSTSSNAVSSIVQAGNNLTIQATASNLNVIGSQLQAGNNALLTAADNINLLAAANTSSSLSNSSGSGASIGVGFNLGVKPSVSVTVSANNSQGNSNGNDTTYTNSLVSASNTASLSSGNDTTLKGAQVIAKQVMADVGGNLAIETLQDTSTYKENGSSSGFSLTVPIIGTNWGVGAGIGQTKIDSDYRSANQQSGIQAGDSGFQVSVQGNTDLKGAVIASNQKAIDDGNNLLITGTLTTSDLQNKASYSGQSINLGIGYSSDGKGTGTNQEGQPTTGAGQTPGSTLSSLNGWSATPPVALSASGEASGTSKSAISQGTVIITDDATQQALTGKDGATTVASLNRDTQNANGSIAPIFNKDEIKAGFEISQTFVQQVGTFVNDQALKGDAAKAALDAETHKPLDQQDAAKVIQLQQAVNDAAQWGPGGTYRQVLTALTAASSGNVTASGGQFLQSMAVDYLQGLAVQQVKSIADSFMKEGNVTLQSEAVRTALQALTACAGAAAQNQSCGAGAMGAAASVVLNNALNALTGTDSDKLSAQQKEAQRNLVATLVAGVATAGGENAATAANAAILEIENNGLLMELSFLTRYPLIATRIGSVSKGSNNISSVAARIAAQGDNAQSNKSILDARTGPGQEGLGDERGAFRHALWQAEISNQFGVSIAIQVGDAHEDSPFPVSQYQYQSLEVADQAVDLLNNAVGRGIGGSIAGKLNSRDMAYKVLEVFKQEGLWVANKADDGSWVVQRQLLSNEKFDAMKSALENKDANGNWSQK